MLKSAKEENKSPLEIAEHYTKLFFEDLASLNIEKPEIICKATEHIPEMIEYVKKLMENGYAYETSTAIYFDISKLDQYGILSGIDTTKQMAGARVEVDAEKRNPQDFALWIKAPKNHLMKWESPWGMCYPGWHIECSAMGQKYLGEQFDIHTGGIDLIPTHHENEIAQSKGLCGKVPARYWLHGEFLLIDGGKMSKSLGNVYLLKDIKEKGYDPIVYRFFSYSCHYRNKLNFTWDGMEGAEKALERLKAGYKKHLSGTDNVSDELINKYEKDFHSAINDDLNMPLAMGIVWELVKEPTKSKKIAELLLKFDTVLGLDIDKKTNKKKQEIPQEIINLVKRRELARKEQKWEESDKLRDEIAQRGYVVKDTKQGSQISKI